jgi:hypothetical protein
MLDSERPFKTLKLNKSKSYFDTSWSDYIRNDWCFGLEKMIARSNLPDADKVVAQHELWRVVDRLILAEATRHLGSSAVFGNWSDFISRNRSRLEKLFPRVNWDEPQLAPEDVEALLKVFTPYQVFGYSPQGYIRSARTMPFSVTEMVKRFKTAVGPVPPTILRKEYMRLRFNYRTSTSVLPPAGTFYVLNHGSIDAYTSNGRYFGTAMLEPRSLIASREKFYEGTPYPRREPDLDLLSRLYSAAEAHGKTPEKAAGTALPSAVPLASESPCHLFDQGNPKQK